MTKTIHPLSFCLGAVSSMLAVSCAIYLSPMASAPHAYELARYDTSGNRYVDDHGLTLIDCLDEMQGKRSTGCEVER